MKKILTVVFFLSLLSRLQAAQHTLFGDYVVNANNGFLTNATIISGSAPATILTSGTLPTARMPALTGDVTSSAGAVSTTLAASGVSAATYGDATHVAQIAVDAKGRITSASSVAISGSGGLGDVTAAAPFSTDNVVIRSDGTGKGVQKTGVVIDDSDNVTIPGTLTTGAGSVLGSITFGDSDNSNHARFQATNVMVTNLNVILPVAPYNGLLYFTVINGTNALLNATNNYAGLLSVVSDINSATRVFTGVTLDAAATGNVVKQTKYINLQRPDYGDGAGAVPQTNTFTASGLMHYTISGNAETNANWIVYEFDCPPDLDTSVAMTARFAFLSGGTDSDDYVFHITYSQVSAGATYVTGESISTLPIVMTVTPTTAANGDLQQSSATTLTGWAAALTPGSPMQVRIARLQNSQDDSARDIQLVIAYGSTL